MRPLSSRPHVASVSTTARLKRQRLMLAALTVSIIAVVLAPQALADDLGETATLTTSEEPAAAEEPPPPIDEQPPPVDEEPPPADQPPPVDEQPPPADQPPPVDEQPPPVEEVPRGAGGGPPFTFEPPKGSGLETHAPVQVFPATFSVSLASQGRAPSTLVPDELARRVFHAATRTGEQGNGEPKASKRVRRIAPPSIDHPQSVGVGSGGAAGATGGGSSVLVVLLLALLMFAGGRRGTVVVLSIPSPHGARLILRVERPG
jgi:outer membrane biosynthesis protein TonB